MAEDDILFGSDLGSSVRESYAFNGIINARDQIIAECGKCEGGYIMKEKKVHSIEDLGLWSAHECECRARAEKIGNYIKSGIPNRFHAQKSSALDHRTSESLKLYTERLPQAIAKGIGIVFYGNDNETATSLLDEARTWASIKILKAVLQIKKTAHYIRFSNYVGFIRECIVDHERTKQPLISEIQEVDFLCIDDFGSMEKTDFILSEFENLIRKRSMDCKPTILVTRFTETELIKKYGIFLVGSIKQTCIPLVITKFSDARSGVDVEVLK